MKQKIVIRVEMSCDRCRSKALSLVAAMAGVDSVALAGAGRDQLVIAGNSVDSIKLACALRKKVGPAEIVQVTTEAPKKDAGGGDNKKTPVPAAPAATAAVPRYVWPYQYPPPQPPVSFVYEPPSVGYAYGYQQARPDSICSIM